MREFEMEQASLNVKWTYERIMPALPVTGTEAFGILCKKLSPFGLSAARILFEAPSTKLSDAVMTIILLDGRLGIKFWISSFEIIVDELYEDDEQNVVDIASAVFDALGKIDEDVTKGTAHIRLMYHLRLAPNENLKILAEHLQGAVENNTLIPEMAIYQVNLEGALPLQNARVAIAKSVGYEDSIFMDMNLDYTSLEDLTGFKDKIKSDVVGIFTVFGLGERKTE